MKQIPSVKCPTCKQRGDWLSGHFAPFCSRRCQLVDLGKWFNEEHCISEPLGSEPPLEDEKQRQREDSEIE